MTIEQMPNSASGTSKKHGKLDAMTLELERINGLTSNTTDSELKEMMIQKMDKLNEQIGELEKDSGLSAKEIMQGYTKLSERLEKGEDIDQLIKRLSGALPVEQRGAFFEAIKSGSSEVVMSMFQSLAPRKMAMATALILAMSVNVVGNVNMAEAGSISNKQRVELKKKIQNPTQAWEYLLEADKKHSLKALEEIKYALGYGNQNGLAGIINYLAVAKEMGATAYANSLGLNYYELDKNEKERVSKQFEKYLEKKGLSKYFQMADNLKHEKKNKENSFLRETKKIEDKLKTPLIKKYEQHMRKTEIMGYSAFRDKYMREGLSPQETAEKIIKLMDGGAKRYFENNK